MIARAASREPRAMFFFDVVRNVEVAPDAAHSPHKSHCANARIVPFSLRKCVLKSCASALDSCPENGAKARA